MAMSAIGTLLGALAALGRLAAQVLTRILHPLLRAYYEHQTHLLTATLRDATDRGDLDGARHARRRLLDLKAAADRLR